MAGKKYSRKQIAGRRAGVFFDLTTRSLPIRQIAVKRGVNQRTIDRDLAALRQEMSPELSRQLRQIALANARNVFKPEKAERFIAFCHNVIRGKVRLPMRSILPKYSKRNPKAAREIARLLRRKGKPLRKIAIETGSTRKTVTVAYRRMIALGWRIEPRGLSGAFGKTALIKAKEISSEAVIEAMERAAKKLGLTVQEKAVAYCKMIGLQQYDMSKRVGVSKQLISKLLNSVKEKMRKAEATKA